MIAPDKRTSYGHLIRDELNNYSSAMDLMPGKHQINWIDTHGEIKGMINNHVMDVYLPNDIHWGSAGYRAAFLSVKKKVVQLSSK